MHLTLSPVDTRCSHTSGSPACTMRRNAESIILASGSPVRRYMLTYVGSAGLRSRSTYGRPSPSCEPNRSPVQNPRAGGKHRAGTAGGHRGARAGTHQEVEGQEELHDGAAEQKAVLRVAPLQAPQAGRQFALLVQAAERREVHVAQQLDGRGVRRRRAHLDAVHQEVLVRRQAVLQHAQSFERLPAQRMRSSPPRPLTWNWRVASWPVMAARNTRLKWKKKKRYRK